MTDPKHSTIKDYIPNSDGSVSIDTKAYYEQLSSHRREIEQRIKTDHSQFLADLMRCARIMKDQKAREVSITIHGDEALEPRMITTKYTVMLENYDRRKKK